MRLPTAKTWRTIAAATLWALIVLGTAWTAVRLFGLERGYPLVPLIAYTPYVPVVAAIALIAALLLRFRLAAALCAAIAVTLAILVVPRALSGQGPDDPPSGPHLTVMTSNLRYGNADPEALVGLVRDQDVDLLSVQELTSRAVRGLRRAGLDDLLPEQALAPGATASGSGLYSRYPLRAPDLTTTGSVGFAWPTANLDVPGAPAIEVMVVHTPPPKGSSQVDGWFADFDALPVANPQGAIRLLAGDFNATLDHAPLRDLINTGYVDAADAAGAGLSPTWPSNRIFPPVTIDHVLVDERVWVADVSVHDLPRTDHRAVVAELVVPPA